MTNYYKKYVYAYMSPFFSQAWTLFAPEPATYSLKMFYRCKDNYGQWLNWKDSVDNLIKAHQKNRFTFYGKLIYVYQGIFRNLLNKKVKTVKELGCDLKKKKCFEEIENKVYSSEEYKRVSQMVSYLCLKEKQYSQYEFKLLRIYAKNFSKRHDDRAKQKVLFDSYKSFKDVN